MLLACVALVAGAAPVTFPDVVPGRTLAFPADEGSHPDFRIEWWYVTGWVEDDAGRQRGFQVTFFRRRADTDDGNPSAFAPRQFVVAHAAISDPRIGRLLHAERAARAGFGLAEARAGRTDVVLEDWSLVQQGDTYRARVRAADFALNLDFRRTQPPLLQGVAGFSQKGPDPRSASHYYSLPQLAVSGEATVQGKAARVTGHAWLDHEWSSRILDASAVGWDWIGINLADGGALMVFRLRDRTGAQHWAGGSWRDADGTTRMLAPGEISWTPGRRWRSPRTGIEYPVEWRVQAGGLSLSLRPLMDDQESDSRRSAGTIYWEGAVEARDAAGRPLGQGYLELTGYGGGLDL